MYADSSVSGGYAVIAAGDVTTPVRAAFRIVPQDTAPSSAQRGDMYVDSATGKLKIYNGSAWESVGVQTA